MEKKFEDDDEIEIDLLELGILISLEKLVEAGIVTLP